MSLLKKGIALAIMFLFTGCSTLPSIGSDVSTIDAGNSSGGTLYVGGNGPGNYSSIKNAIDDSSTIKIDKQKNKVLSKTEDAFSEKNIDDLIYENLHHTKYVQGELIVKFKENTHLHFTKSQDEIVTMGITSVDALNKAYDVKSISKVFGTTSFPSLSKVYKFILPNDVDILLAARRYTKNPYVEYAQPNYIMKIYLTPNDPYYSSYGSWGQNFLDLYGMYLLDMDDAWNFTTGSHEVVVAVLDTGDNCKGNYCKDYKK